MSNNHRRITVTGIATLIGTTLTVSPHAGTGGQPTPDITRGPQPGVVGDTDVNWPLPRGTCPAFDLAPVAVLKPGPCGRLESVTGRGAGGGSAGTISIAHMTPSPR